MRFTNKVCIVTGATSGIGRATAERMGEEGGKVVVVGRADDRGHEVVQYIVDKGSDAFFADIDLSDPSLIQNVVDETIARWGQIDIVVNDAAMMTFDPIVDLSLEDWEKVQTVNMRSVFLLCKLTIPHINGGAIVNVSSVHAFQTTANVVPYAASKGAMEAFTRGLSLENDIAKVRVNCVAPGAVDTPMLWDNPNVKSGKEKITGAIGKPEDIASAICYLASDEARFINGTTLAVDGGRLAQL
ncbi:NAD(P)-dependent dehydrogenase (short-subunit alcohol dehydrogenase family) [Spirosoma oryzae]|uniref:NAD(P)-dependent dehydrogenase (Short-subunit alcohol dehydrogenase family) n=1 Tax=Spirosoma oryzae TaxID=1469603 RepID=A0A2T0TNY2_9BACT|nr:glucose 1-dehydrogenase [Spirosoma oryzae]PRY47337.1 NAD(P)-dependent dehydrogenase (short-subunit alcohol dehydrogenase family) [Spirosoma oryzae]